MVELTDAELKARIAAMTWAQRLALTIRCEEALSGTELEPLAQELREALNAMRRGLN
jgi:hypothetical protein